MTQTDMILQMLIAAGTKGITPLEALRFAGSMRLAARVQELRSRGYEIKTERTKGRHARYVLIGK